MAGIVVLETCPRCKGTGVDVSGGGAGAPEKPCENCGAVGERQLAYSTDLDTKLNALDTKLDALDTHLDTIETKIDAL